MSRRSGWPLVIAFVVMTLGSAAHAQKLTLGRSVEAPPLDGVTFAGELVGRLEREIAQRIDRQRNAGAIEHESLRMQINWRLVATDLLRIAHQDGPRGVDAFVAGHRLVRGGADLDGLGDALVALATRIADAGDAARQDDVLRYRRCREAFAAFDTAVQTHGDVFRVRDVRALDAALAAVFAPLLEAVLMLEGVELVDHWIPIRRIVDDPGAPSTGLHAGGTPGPAATIETLTRRLNAATMPAATRALLVESIDMMRDGGTLGSTQPTVVRYQGLLEAAIDLPATLDAASWFPPDRRTAYMERLHQAVTLFREPSTRHLGEPRLDRLASSQRLLQRFNGLEAMSADVTALTAVFLDADARTDNPAEAAIGAQHLRHLSIIAERMVAYRSLETDELKGPLRSIQRQLDRQYRRAENKLLENVDLLLEDSRALADPAVASLLVDQKQYLDDLTRVTTVSDWVDTVRLIRPSEASAFLKQARKMCNWLLDTNRRDDAVRAMKQFEQQLSLFYPLPHELELRRGDARTMAVVGESRDALLRQIDRQRADWAQGWSDGNASSEAANRMLLLYRLMQIIADASEVSRLDEDATGLNRWSPWEIGGPIISRDLNDLPTRLQLALTAATAGDDRRLRRQLDRIDGSAPLVKLAGRLTSRLGPALDELPRGVASILGQTLRSPGDEAWMRHRRHDFALLSRYALELEFARQRNDVARADAAGTFLNELVGDLLTELGEPQRELPTLIGFDGSDPDPDVDTPGSRRR